jgi:(S)-citramalyl-CoA lyase
LLIWRSILFAPATRPERFGKAVAAGADAVVLDLEDSVPPAEKAQAREKIRSYLESRPSDGGPALAVRINSIMSAEGLRDLLAILDTGARPDAVLLPKVEAPDQVILAANILGTIALVPLIETIAGLRAADAIARAGAAMLGFGSGDYAAEVGCAMSAAALASPRTHLVQAAAQAGIACFDGAWLSLDDIEGLDADCALARDMGFCGKPALHPRQVVPINRAFTPDAEAVAEAAAIVAALEAAGGGVAVHRGRMLDAPVVRQAERVLALAANASGKGVSA